MTARSRFFEPQLTAGEPARALSAPGGITADAPPQRLGS
jgi:hypothetical protein